MNTEAQRRAYLCAMQVDVWLPRMPLPFAAPSRPALFELPAEAFGEPEMPVAEGRPVVEARRETPSPRLPRVELPKPLPEKAEPARDEAPPVAMPPPPRFALQLLRAGDCLLLLELPTGEPFQSRDPAYLLLKDLLRAAALPDSPRQVGDGEPIRWPLRGLDAGAEAARDYVQGVLAREAEQGSRCVWLIGSPALRHAGEAGDESLFREVQVDGVGAAWALPGLEALMEAPALKAELWRAMRRVMQRWTVGE